MDTIIQGDIDRTRYATLPREAVDFLDSLLHVNPIFRLTAEEAIEHVWVK